jgi:hypothetical protein
VAGDREELLVSYLLTVIDSENQREGLRRFDMWEQSLLTSSGQVEALRLLSDWWDSSRSRPLPARHRNLTARGARVADALVLPPGHRPAHLDERLAEVS